MIYLRDVTDEQGDTVDLFWYCCYSCYSDSFKKHPSDATLRETWQSLRKDGSTQMTFEQYRACTLPQSMEEGGAYPCGAESDCPDYCETCGAPVGNPLTDDGAAYVVEFVTDVLSSDGFDTRGREDRIATARALYREYGYAFANVELPSSIY